MSNQWQISHVMTCLGRWGSCKASCFTTNALLGFRNKVGHEHQMATVRRCRLKSCDGVEVLLTPRAPRSVDVTVSHTSTATAAAVWVGVEGQLRLTVRLRPRVSVRVQESWTRCRIHTKIIHQLIFEFWVIIEFQDKPSSYSVCKITWSNLDKKICWS